MTLRVSVLDMQPISPPVGGGRLRLLGLYHGLGSDCAAEYVGTYDWPGEPARTNRLSQTLLERTVPLEDAHFTAARAWSDRAGGRVVIDVTFPQLAHLSPAYVAAARRSAAAADVVVFSHPWVFPVVRDLLADKLVVYDAQNVEGVLRARLLGDHPVGEVLARQVALLEAALCREADLVLACSLEDRDAFHRIYGVPLADIVVVPNGAFTAAVRPAGAAERQRARAAVGVGEAPLCLFLGSLYPPNLEAATWIAERLAPALPEVTFAICGGVGEALRHLARANLLVTGQISPARRDDYLAAADLAVNPMLSGSGTNVKMLELMAAGLPVVTTPVGARGIDCRREEPFLVAEVAELADAVRRVVADPQLAARLGRTARRHAEVRFSWETISERLGHLLRHAWRHRGRSRPFFSVVVPTRDRPEKLAGLLRCLQMQTYRDFEVVVADQSRDEPPPLPDDLDVSLLRPRVAGAVRARNAASFCAGGEVLAFVDDDCQPMADWLAKARRRFDNPLTVGVEGRIMGHPGEPGAHWVCNDGVRGLGFLTANLFVRREAFVRASGFDESFEDPHFREDSDLGWRLLDLGEVPFGDDVLVYHPPHDAPVGEEWLERAFANDALLYRKHPYAYRCLQAREPHAGTDRYRRGLLRGAAAHGVDVAPLLRPRARGRPLREGRATLRLVEGPLLVLPAAAFTVRLAITNETGVAWARDGEWPVRLSYRWRDAVRLVVENGQRTALPYDLHPGETAAAVCQVVAPERPGSYDLLVTLVQEGVSWWDETTATALFHRVGVVAAPARGS
jgi:glycosyltransferase involved in cell wall biosynthesis/GT2 family glycosyltransferase